MVRRVLSIFEVCVAAALVAAAGAGTRPDAVHGTFAGANGNIAFAVSDFVVSPIYSIDPDGGSPTPLTTSADYRPTWSPNGTKIALIRQVSFSCPVTCDLEVYVMNADGSGQTNLTNNVASDSLSAWSPDGTKIAFVSNRVGLQTDVYVMNADGSSPANLTNNSASDSNPVWSPDGTKIAFESTRDGNGEIYVMNANGSGQTNLTNNAAFDANMVWSPDGTKIAFESDRDGNSEIYVMNANGSGQTNITNNAAADSSPVWSPDRTKIAFVTNRNGNSEIYVMQPDGVGQVDRTNSSPDDFGPTWSPDSTMLAFSVLASPGGQHALWELRTVGALTGGSTLLYSAGALACCSPDWQPLRSVGGIARLPNVEGVPSAEAAASGASVGFVATLAAIFAGAIAIGGVAWRARRRAKPL